LVFDTRQLDRWMAGEPLEMFVTADGARVCRVANTALT
jgi:hypothetical protein